MLQSLAWQVFNPHPLPLAYGDPSVLGGFAGVAVLLIFGILLRIWRRGLKHTLLRRMSLGWSSASFAFGVIALLLIVARAEEVLFLSMRLWWVLWLLAAVLYILLQWKLFRARYYEVLPTSRNVDEREKYLPKKKRH